MTQETTRENPEDEPELDEPDGDDDYLLVVTLSGGRKNQFFVKPDALKPGQWGILLADAVRMVAWSLAESSGDASDRRQAEMIVLVKNRLLDELEHPTSDMEVWTEGET